MDASDGLDPPSPVLPDPPIYDRQGHLLGYGVVGCPVDEVIRAPEPGESLRVGLKPGEVVQLAFEAGPEAMRIADGDLTIEVQGGRVVLSGFHEARPELLDVDCDFLRLPPHPHGQAPTFEAPYHPADAAPSFESIGLDLNPHG